MNPSPFRKIINPNALLVKTRVAIEYFGSKAEMARVFELERASVSDWGLWLPPLRSWQFRQIQQAYPVYPGS